MKPIPRCPGYFADEEGRIWSDVERTYGSGLRRLGGMAQVKGYPVVRIRQDGRKMMVRVHVLVARAFYGERPRGMEIRHLDGNRTNHRPQNLRYGTKAENTRDAFFHGTSGRKLTASDIPWIRAYRASGYRQFDVARAFGVNRLAIWCVETKRTWAMIP